MKEESDTIKLLLVDDDLEFLGAIIGPLSRRGFEVTQAQDGAKALKLLKMDSFDVVVLDVKMPGMDGVTVFHHIRNLYLDLPVILLTGHGTVQQAFETSRAGVFEYLTKPCDVGKLAAVVRRAADQARRNRAQRSDDARTEEIRLLFVDDELDLLESLSQAFRKRGVQVSTASSAREAVSLLEQQIFDVALVDLRMPEINGVELLNFINKLESPAQVIILTGQPSMGKIVEAAKYGAFDILIKPQNVEKLMERIRKAHLAKQERARNSQEKKVKRILEFSPD